MIKFKILPVFILVAILLTISGSVFYFYLNNTPKVPEESNISNTTETSWISSSFIVNTTDWNIGEAYEVEVLFTDLEGVGMPSGATMEILFDPALLKLNSVTPGDIWDGVTTLEEKINNQEGNAQISYAQALNGSLASGQKYMTMEFEVVGSSKTQTQIQFGEKSEAGWVGQPKLYSIPGIGLTINLN